MKKVLISENDAATRNGIAFACSRLGIETQVVERIPTKKEFLSGHDAVITGFVTSSTLQSCRANGISVLIPVCYIPLAERSTMEPAELAGGIQFISVSGTLPMRLKMYMPKEEPVEGAPGTTEDDLANLGDTQVPTTTETPEPITATIGDDDVPF